jgi:hypothetical protein
MIQELIARARSTMPSTIADEITSVQPINMINPFSKKWERVGIDGPSQNAVYNIRAQEIRDWIEEQPADMWGQYGIDEIYESTPISAMFGQNYVFTEEMEAWFTLRWV